MKTWNQRDMPFIFKKIECDERFCSGEPWNQRDIPGIIEYKM